MIKYSLTCECSYAFDSWFASSEEFERLRKRKLITCIECNSNNVKKSIMSPSVSSSKKIHNENFKFQKNLKKKIVKYQKFIQDNCKYVGDNFAQEARSIYYDKKKSTGIYGRATIEEIKELSEEGIETTTIPWYDKSEN